MFIRISPILLSLLSIGSAQTAASADIISNAAKHVIYSYSGDSPPSSLQRLITDGKVGGVIIFKDNVSPSLPDQVNTWQEAYKNSSAYNNDPLLILTDQEGGEILRLPGGPTLSQKEIGNASDPEKAAASAGVQAAGALKAYNNNGNLAPIAGVYREAGDFLDQFGRSYSKSADVVSRCLSSFVKAQTGEGVLATAKHFPGLGAAKTDENTDERPVTIDLPLSTLRGVDEIPFKAAIQAGVDMIMPSWATYPSLDEHFPSGLSRLWLQDELRKRLGFTGVIISDAIEAGGLDSFGSDDGHRSILAMAAGQDIILAGGKDVNQGSKNCGCASSSGQEWYTSYRSIQFKHSTSRIFT